MCVVRAGAGMSTGRLDGLTPANSAVRSAFDARWNAEERAVAVAAADERVLYARAELDRAMADARYAIAEHDRAVQWAATVRLFAENGGAA